MHRRTMLASVAAGAFVGGLAPGRLGGVAAQDAAVDLSGHPLAGMWLAMANPPRPGDPQFPAPSLLAADGTVLLVFPPTQIGPGGVQFTSPVVGTWEADGGRTGHFTAVQTLSAVDGTFLGSVTIDGYPKVSDDGMTFVDADPRATVTIRDAAGAVVQRVPITAERPVTGIRMAPGVPGFPTETTDATDVPPAS